jgi:hypothetical protein
MAFCVRRARSLIGCASSRLIPVAVLLVITVSSPLFAQNAELRGSVTDESGGVLPGVTVTVKNTGTGVERVLVTEATGTFRVPALQPGPTQSPRSCRGFVPMRVK